MQAGQRFTGTHHRRHEMLHAATYVADRHSLYAVTKRRKRWRPGQSHVWGKAGSKHTEARTRARQRTGQRPRRRRANSSRRFDDGSFALARAALRRLSRIIGAWSSSFPTTRARWRTYGRTNSCSRFASSSRSTPSSRRRSSIPLAARSFPEEDMLDEAQVEHDSAKLLIADLMEARSGDRFRDAKISVLREQIKHHVGEEEMPGTGIMAQARAHGVDRPTSRGDSRKESRPCRGALQS